MALLGWVCYTCGYQTRAPPERKPRPPRGCLRGRASGIARVLTTTSTISAGSRVLSLVVIVVGVPLAAAAAGWLLPGREPPAIARPAIE